MNVLLWVILAALLVIVVAAGAAYLTFRFLQDAVGVPKW